LNFFAKRTANRFWVVVAAEVEEEEPQAQNPRFAAAQGVAVPAEREAANFDLSS
jgi:Ni,Fe-hydrogenase III component G